MKHENVDSDSGSSSDLCRRHASDDYWGSGLIKSRDQWHFFADLCAKLGRRPKTEFDKVESAYEFSALITKMKEEVDNLPDIATPPQVLPHTTFTGLVPCLNVMVKSNMHHVRRCLCWRGCMWPRVRSSR